MWKRLSVLWLMVKGDVKRLGFALLHPEAPGWLKGGSALLVLYLLSPIDFIPDMIPLLGVMDDAIIIPVVIRWMLKRLQPARQALHVQPGGLDDSGSAHWPNRLQWADGPSQTRCGTALWIEWMLPIGHD
jgi:uncharacterized membrane protein YkvA (DUF1232 family)